MPAPIYIEKRNPLAEAVQSIIPVMLNFLMTKEYLQEGISEKEFKKLKAEIPEVEKIFTKKGKRYVLSTEVSEQALQDMKLKDVLLEYYQRENIKQKYKQNPFTYLGNIQHIITNPFVMNYLEGLTEGVKQKEEKKKAKQTEQVIQEQILPQLLQSLGITLPDAANINQTLLPWLSLLKIAQTLQKKE